MYSFKTFSLSIILLCSATFVFGQPEAMPQEEPRAPNTAAILQRAAHMRDVQRHQQNLRQTLMHELKMRFQANAIVICEHQADQLN